MFTVVCIFGSGAIIRKQRRDLASAQETLRESQESGLYASGSIWSEDDEEIDGFTREYHN